MTTHSSQGLQDVHVLYLSIFFWSYCIHNVMTFVSFSYSVQKTLIELYAEVLNLLSEFDAKSPFTDRKLVHTLPQVTSSLSVFLLLHLFRLFVPLFKFSGPFLLTFFVFALFSSFYVSSLYNLLCLPHKRKHFSPLQLTASSKLVLSPIFSVFAYCSSSLPLHIFFTLPPYSLSSMDLPFVKLHVHPFLVPGVSLYGL